VQFKDSNYVLDSRLSNQACVSRDDAGIRGLEF